MNPVIDLFGDESVVNSAITYGLVLLPCDKTRLAENALNRVKIKFGGIESNRLHCRELFAGDKRKSTAWAHLSIQNVFDLCWESANSVALAGAMFRIGFVDRSRLPKIMSFGGHLPETPADPKQLIAFAYTIALAGLEKNPGIPAVRLWQDPDHTKIPWGGRRRKAGNVPLTFDVQGPNAIKPQVIQGDKPILLDVADILAYCSAQVLSAEMKRDKAQFRRIYDRFSPDLRKIAFNEQTFA